MERLKKVVSLLLCLVMVVGLLPMSVFAASSDSKTEYLMLGSDRHGNTSVIGQLLTKMSSIIGPDAKMDYVGLLGDMVDNTNSYDTATILSEVQSGASYMTSANVDVLYAAHDKGTVTDANGMLNKTSGEWYSGTNYYVYGVVQDDMDANYESASAKFVEWAKALPDDGKVIVVISHMPIHAKRGDNTGGGYWHNALNTVANATVATDGTISVERNVLFFHGHNHTEDGTEYFYPVGSTMSIENYVAPSGVATVADNSVQVYDSEIETYATSNGTDATIYYTYATAGYMLTSSGRGGNGHATLLAIGEDTISLARVDYDTGLVTSTNEYAYDTDGYAEVARVASSTDSGDSGEEETTDPSEETTDPSEETTDPTEGEEEGGTTTTTTTYNYTATANTDGTGYILVSNGYALQNNDGTMSAVAVTVSDDGSTVTFDSSVDVSTILWTIDSDGKMMNGSYYFLRTSGSGSYIAYISETCASEEKFYSWTYSGTTLTCTSTSNTYYAYYNTDQSAFYTSQGTEQTLKFYVPTETEAAVTLSSIAVTTAPTTIVYNVGDTFSEEGLVVTATYSDGSTKAVTGCTLSGYDMNTAGEQTVTVTYTEGDVTKTATFTITVSETISETATVTGIKVTGAKTDYTLGESFTADGMVVTVSYTYNGTTKTKVLSADEYTVSEVDMTTEGEKTVTVSYTYNGTTVTDTYTVTVTEASSNEVTLSGTTTTPTTKTVYVLTSSISSDKSYLIVNGNSAGSYYALANNSGSVAATGVTVKTDSTIGTYIELTDATDELWTVANGYTFKNGSYYLYPRTKDNGSLELNTQSRNWSYSNNQLFYDSQYYLYYSSSSGWDVSKSSANVYFYVPTEIKVDTTVTYTMRAEDLKQVVDTTNTATLTATLDYCLQGNGADLTTLPSGGSYSFTVLSDENRIISGITDGTVNFTGNTGTAKVKVAYTWTQDGQTYTVYKNITIEASDPYYTLDLHHAVYTFTEANITEFASDVTYYVLNADGTYSVTTDTEYVSGTTYYTATVTVGDEITETVAIKGVEEGDTYSAWAVIKYYDGIVENGEDGVDLGDINDNDIEWTSSDTTIATVDAATGIITFTGKEGTVNITATYLNGNKPSDTITISVTASQYSVPADGTSDFPEYPNEGAIRFDKTATAVGNFSETGIAQVELSMTGVPYTTGSEVDVVLMLDITGSMTDVEISSYTYSKYARIEYTILASQAFVESIVKNEDGSYNENRVGVYSFNSKGTYTLFSLGTISSDTELTAAKAAIAKLYDDYASGGTPYDDGLALVQSTLAAAKTDGTGNNRQQFAVFMTDGVPTDYEYVTGTTHANYSSASSIAGMLTSSDDYCTRDTDYYYEYYSTEMKKDGVTVYTVGIGLENTNSAWSGTATQCLNLASRLLNDISGPANETTQPDAVGTSTLSKKDTYFFSVEDADAATEMENVFTSIAVKILQAATNVTVEDKITDEYTMIFDIPTNTAYGKTIEVDQDFYIEFVKYALDENHERTTETSITKLYLGKSNGSYYAASDSNGTAYASPVFAQTTIGDKGTLYYWTTDQTYASKAAVSYSDGTTTYYFIPYGKAASSDGTAPTGWYNMTSGGYASGTVDPITNMSQDLVIATPYFVYNAATRMLYWTVDKLDTYEYALRYFLYLDNSATDIGEDTEVPADAYPTNEHAYITYTNFNGNACQQKFPVPQLTWNGAQVSYVFYLVNEAGQPINKSGQVVDFANATFITDVFTHSVVWNGDNAVEELNVEYLAANLLPSDYIIYDENAEYTIHVYQTAEGATVFDYFIIKGGTADSIADSLNKRLPDSNLTSSDVSIATTKVYNTKAGTKYSDYGTYSAEKVGTEFTTTDANGNEAKITTSKQASLDYSDTTVAFAVVWKPTLVPDTVVVDFGLDVLIDVVQNDLMQNTVSGIGLGTDAYGNVAMNTGVSTESKLGTAALTTSDGSTISIENENQIRFHQNDMTFQAPVTFYYESPVKYYEGSNQKEGYMYSSVTVIPATTIYYEDDFLTLASYTKNDDGTYTKDETSQWTTEYNTGATTGVTATQDQDRPGKSQISADLDADNNYGYDSAYESQSQFSMGSAAMVTVKSGVYATAKFEFYGTGFDIISMTDTTTGVIIVKVYDENGKQVLSETVNNYYGYKRVENDGTVSWVVTTPDDPNALYQVPVLKIGDGDTTEALSYGKYTAEITVSYIPFLDMTEDEGYDFYLDAIRIYNPTGNLDDTANNAYVADGEGWPIYKELRNLIITANSFGEDVTVTSDNYSATTKVKGVVFIDGIDENTSIADYTSYGPNNELYLAAGQSIAFNINDAFVDSNGDSITPVDVQLAIKTVGGSANIEIFNPGIKVTTTTKTNDDGSTTTTTTTTATKDNLIAETLNTATDMYYSISALADGTIVISSTSGIISITNIKFTFEESAQVKTVTTTSDDGTEETSEAAVASISEEGAVYSLRSLSAYSVTEIVETEATEPETEATEPETEATEPETEATEPETEATEPETEATEPETEETVPETTEPEDTESAGATSEIIETIFGIIKKLFSWLFG